MKSFAVFFLIFSLIINSDIMAQEQHAPEQRMKKMEVIPQQGFMPEVFPPSWWTGMVHNEIELMLHAPGISNFERQELPEGLEFVKETRVENINYIFLTVRIAKNATSGIKGIMYRRGDVMVGFPFEILGAKSHQPNGLNANDIIYLLMPDRFANGNPSNDVVKQMNETEIDRNDWFKRHGGDLQGVIDHLDYIQDLGVTALWLNPVQENDQHKESYHGYAITNHYQIDRRLGSNDLYQSLVKQAHEKDLKVIMDVILNHVGDEHFFIKDLPSKEWVNIWSEYKRTSFRATTLMDPYVHQEDKDLFAKGWFDKHMPDLNQKNPQLARFLVQAYLWWVEYAKLDGFRVDTYAYPDLEFSESWVQAMLKEYPNLGIFGEVWDHGIAVQSFFTQRGLPSITDFQMNYAILEAINQKPSWTGGVNKLYYTLAQDFVYKNPQKNVVFLDNHDLGRFWSVIGEDFSKYQMGISLLLFTRGIPMVYTGTELLFAGEGGAFGEGGRVDFPGGWKEDSYSAFEESGRNEDQQRALQFFKEMLKLRKQFDLEKSKFIHHLPQDGIYICEHQGASKNLILIYNFGTKPVDCKTYMRGNKFSSIKAFETPQMDSTNLTLKPGMVRGFTMERE